MLDTIRHPQFASGTERFDHRINVRPRPSFGLGSLRNSKFLLAFGTVVCLAIAALYLALRPTTYTASSQLLIYMRQILSGPDQAILQGRADLSMVQNQIELLRSGNVLGKVVEALQLTKDPEFISDIRVPSGPKTGDPTHRAPDGEIESAAYRAALRTLNRELGIRQRGTSHIVTVSFKASDPEKASRIVDSVIRTYMQERARAFVAASSKAPTLRELHQSLGPSAQVVSEAVPPVKADGPPAALILAAAALLGLSAAASAALVLDACDDTIRGAHQMEYVLGLECLGVVPRFPRIGAGGAEIAAERLLASQSPMLRRAAAMMQEASSGGARRIGVTSVVPGEGATTLAIGLAMAAAEAGQHVLLIDAVRENPSISRWAAYVSRTWLQREAAPEGQSFDDVVQVQAGLDILPLAAGAGDEARLMGPNWLDDSLSAAEASYDLVIVDLPSLVGGPQVRAAAQTLDGFLLVVKWGATESELVRQAFQSAGQARQKFIGTVLNIADDETMKRYGYKRPAETKLVTTS
ncbi:MAG TPA: Wzz/FepE/Etk N-terminal domain-containing protein [Bosea sp. (in: a-proteobacteria)]